MALIFGDSFDHYGTADILKKWTSQSSSANPLIAVEYAMPPHTVALNLASTTGQQYLEKTLPATEETFVAGCWFWTDSTAAASIILAFYDGATEHVSVRYTTSGNITFTRNGTVLATSTNTLSTGTWYHIETKVTIGDAGDTPSGQYEVRVNGTATNWIAASGTGQDTRNGGNKNISIVKLGSRAANSSTVIHRFQDFYFLDTSGSYANDFLGACRFVVIRPAAAGNYSDWVGNYADNFANVQEDIGDEDSTFNMSSTASDKDTFVMDDLPTGTVHAIQHVLLARQDAGAARTIRPLTRISGSDYNGTSVATTGSYIFVCEPVSASPASGVQWTDSEINGAEFGYELVS